MRRLTGGFRPIGLCAALIAALALAACSTGKPRGTKAPLPPIERSIGNYKVGKPYQIGGVWYYPKVDYNYDKTGIASWYGPGFHGRQTANGEIFDQNALSAAHPTLPMPSVVEVTNLENGRVVAVRINDRGPFKNGRIIDMSKRGAQLLGFERQGTAKVRVRILEDESRQHALAAQNKSAPPELAAKAAVPVTSVAAAPLDPDGTQTAAATVVEPKVVERETVVEWPTGQVQNQRVANSRIYIQAGSFLRRDNATRLSVQLSRYGQSRVVPLTVGKQHYFRVRLGPIASVSKADGILQRLLNQGLSDAHVIVDQ